MFSSCTDALDEIEFKQTDEMQTKNQSTHDTTNTIVYELDGLIR